MIFPKKDAGPGCVPGKFVQLSDQGTAVVQTHPENGMVKVYVNNTGFMRYVNVEDLTW